MEPTFSNTGRQLRDKTRTTYREDPEKMPGPGRVSLDLPGNAMVSVSAAELAALRERADGPPQILSTTQAADHFGFTPKRWRQWCEDGTLPGAFKDERARWRIHRDEAARCIDEYRRKRSNREGGPRGPRNKKATPTSAQTP